MATFALSPSLANAAAFIDFATAEGVKLYNKATAELATKYDVEPETTNLFIEKLRDRAMASGWDAENSNILTVPVNGRDRNLLTEHGTMTSEQLRAHVLTYAANETRQAQNAYMMYHCIMNSLTEAGHNKVLNQQDEYMVNGIPNGPLLFKLLMKKALIDTRATLTHIRTNLSNLDSYIVSINSNIELFNQYV